MKRKSTNYKSYDSGGWMHKCDDLFLSRYRGRPCVICGKTSNVQEDGTKVKSCGHHLIFKGKCRQFRYEPKNIVVLCAYHHSHYNSEISPHSITSTMAQKRFAQFIKKKFPKQYAWWMENESKANKPFDKSWTYREMYEKLGGEIETKTGKVSDYRPVRHSPKVKANEMGGHS